ncbi:hypothetical protein NBRC111894_924 [Sporolactobacillus inulinus]|uniref:B3/B4 tRNA-binding domain-containing protein n=1 Tax=Sporolactobacillus inulinus TaxID=2078 RepID=A0A4Y1Z8R3_9BACL|nr:phenylalanine--tRNA ligase beta subunit-related protein [Sporolactobacillus inulinus]GAY75370.1 hypothetical protein NBRC111894_924 [Sporolactobacillus inulinus]
MIGFKIMFVRLEPAPIRLLHWRDSIGFKKALLFETLPEASRIIYGTLTVDRSNRRHVMFDVSISSQLKDLVPDFKIGIIYYPSIAVGELPSLIGERLPLYYENIHLSLTEHPVNEIPGVREWRQVFKKIGCDPSRYRPSQEALLRKIKKDGHPHFIHSAVDLLNFFSVQHGIPMGLYDAAHLENPIQIKIGTDADQYDGLNGRVMHMKDKLVSIDGCGAFGSPIVDSHRTCVTEKTTEALQIIYLRPSMAVNEAQQLIEKMADMFTQVHGGNHEWTLIR